MITPKIGYSFEWTSRGGNNKSSIAANCHLYDFWHPRQANKKRHVDRIIVDMGSGPGDDGAWGYHRILPDVMKDLKDTDAIILTHAHSDHMEAIWFYMMSPFLTMRSGLELGAKLPPIWGTPYTIEKVKQYITLLVDNVIQSPLIDTKDKHHLVKRMETLFDDMRVFYPGNTIRIGKEMEVTPIAASHSTLQCVSLKIQTPTATVYHTGDINDDDTYLHPCETDFDELEEIGEQGVDFVLIDSTGADREKKAAKEQDVRDTFAQILTENPNKRIVTAYMGGHDQRLISIMHETHKAGRDLFVVGKTAQLTFDLFKKMGTVIPRGLNVHYITNKRHQNITPRNNAVVITTGGQGEKGTPLRRALIDRTYQTLTLDPKQDVVVFSNTMLGINEARYRPMLNELERRGFTHYTNQNSERVLNASGHANARGIRRILKALNPTYGVPVHGMLEGRGEGRPKGLLVYCADIMKRLKIEPLLMKNGQTVRLDHPDGPKIVKDGSLRHQWVAVVRAIYDLKDGVTHYQMRRVNPSEEQDQMRGKNKYTVGRSYDHII